MPAVGDDLAGVREISSTLDGLAREGLEPLVDSAAGLDTFAPRDGRVPLDAVADARAPLADGAAVFADAAARLDALDPSGYSAPLRSAYDELDAQVGDAASALAAADKAARLLPTMLGARGQRDWLLVFQNNAEIRATGGLPGAVSVVRAGGGRLRLVAQASGSSMGELSRPVLPLTPEESDVYGSGLGTYFVNANITPDFPRAAELMRARWELEHGGRLAGVVTLDPVTLSYLLEATGTIGGLTPANAVPTLLHEAYLRHEDPAAQDAYFADVARKVFDALSAGTGSPRALASGLARGAAEGRVLVHSFDTAEQAEIAGTRLAGEAFGADAARRVDVTLNDGTGAKMSYFLRYDVVGSATCADGEQVVEARMTLRSEAPPDVKRLPDYVTGGGIFGTKVGSQMVVLNVFAPEGGRFEAATFGTEKAYLGAVMQSGRQVLTIAPTLDPGEELPVTWRLRTPGPDPTALVVTPGVEPGTESSMIPSSCAE